MTYVYHDDDSGLKNFNNNFYDLKSNNIHPEYDYTNTILNNIDNNNSIIEIGCGTNRLGNIIRTYKNDLIKEYIGLEPDKVRYNVSNMCETDKFKYFNQFSNEYIKNNPNKKFDIVIISQVIQHVSTKSAIEIIGDAQKLLKQNGKLLLSTTHVPNEFFSYSSKPNISDSKENFDKYCNSNNSSNGLPVHFFSRDTLINYIHVFSNLVVLEWHQYAFVKQNSLKMMGNIFHNNNVNIVKKNGQSQFVVCKKINY